MFIGFTQTQKPKTLLEWKDHFKTNTFSCFYENLSAHLALAP